MHASSSRSSRSLDRSAGAPVPLDGGITNRNYRARFGETDYVIRVPGKDTSLLEIDRQAERVANERAARVGIAPPVAAMLDDPQAIVTVFVEGRGLSAADLREAAALTEVARSLRAIHELGEPLPYRLRLVPDRRRPTPRPPASAARRCPRPSPRRAPAPPRSRRALTGAEHRAGAVPQRPARRQLHPRRADGRRRRGPALDRRLGVRRDGRPLLRPRQLRGQQRARRGRRGGAARRLLRRAADRRAGSRRCG